MSPNETYSTDRVEKCVADIMFRVKNDMTK
jgi:hypothetical protein